MSIPRKVLALSLAAALLAGSGAFAQGPRHGRPSHHAVRRRPMGRPGGRPGIYHRPVPGGYRGGYMRHNDWRRGYRLAPGVWGGGMVINDWGRYRLTAPPYGYQWRYIDGNFVLAAVATGIISSVIIGSMVR